MYSEEILRQHGTRYPRMTPQDAVKLLYQSEFGAGHLAPSEETVVERLTEELAATPDADSPLRTEVIGGGLARLHLAGTLSHGLSLRTIARLFLRAAAPRTGTGFGEKLAVLRRVCAKGELPFSPAALEEYLTGYLAAGCPMVRHSAAYRAAYAPAYRLIRAEDVRLLPLLASIDRAQAAQTPVCVAIDGRSGAGKSTLAAVLGELYGCPVLHMDDYFVPWAEKTPERLAQPGGNADIDRFAREVLPGMTAGEAFTMGIFDCGTQQITRRQTVPPSPLYITEGAYALHPRLAGAYHIKVFLTVDPEEQLRRITRRNGPEMARRFRQEWIPLEEAYFAACDVASSCDFIFEM